DAAAGDIQVDACKTGMLASSAIVEVVEDAINRNKLFPYVCAPVMVSQAGSELLKRDAIDLLKRKLFPLATVVTPNRGEAALLTGADAKALTSVAAAKDVARRVVGVR